jgi:hypothetical protein
MKVKGYMYPQMKKPVGMLCGNQNKMDDTKTHTVTIIKIKYP